MQRITVTTPSLIHPMREPVQEIPMNATTKLIVMRDSPEAASIKTVTGWVSRTGRFFGQDERLARYDGCTHQKCSTEGCEAIIEIRGFTICDACRHAKDLAKFNAMPRKEWDGTGMIFSDAHDKYFNDLWEAQDALEDGETLADLRLIICEPNFLRQVDVDHWNDDLPEDVDELPDAVSDALEALNKAIDAAGPVSWHPGKFSVDLIAAERELNQASINEGPDRR
jgi:hypothetical protein